MQLFGQLGQQVVRANPGAEGASAQQYPKRHDGERANHQVHDDVLVREHDLQRRVQVNHVKADEPRGSKGAFQNLNVKTIGHCKQQVGRDQHGPAPVAPGVAVWFFMRQHDGGTDSF